MYSSTVLYVSCFSLELGETWKKNLKLENLPAQTLWARARAECV